MDKLSQSDARSAGTHKTIPQALRTAIRFPHVPKIEDVGFAIMAKRTVECQRCGWTAELFKFGRHMSDRAGLVTINCECPDCGTTWKRIEV